MSKLFSCKNCGVVIPLGLPYRLLWPCKASEDGRHHVIPKESSIIDGETGRPLDLDSLEDKFSSEGEIIFG